MSLIAKISLRRIRNAPFRSAVLMASVLLSMLMILFLVFFEWQTAQLRNKAYEALPFSSFLSDVRLCMNVTVILLAILTAVTVRTNSRLRSREREQTLAVLAAVGATARQRRRLILSDILLLYLPSVAIGVCLGIRPGIRMGAAFIGAGAEASGAPMSRIEAALMTVLIAVFLVAAGMALVTLSALLPTVHVRRPSVIGAVRRQNKEASEVRHGYRQSRTFRSQSLLRRLAKKRVDYCNSTYNGIALVLAASAMYPITALMMGGTMAKSEIVLDTNPFDGVDTEALVSAAVDRILLFLDGCFPVLFIVGVLQAVIGVRLGIAERQGAGRQGAGRQGAGRTYRQIGMTEADTARLTRLEVYSICLRSLLYLIIGIAGATAGFSPAFA